MTNHQIMNEITLVSLRFQCMLITISFLIVGYAIYHVTDYFYSFDPIPIVFPLTPEKIKEYGGKPTIVDVSLIIRDFPVFDIIKGNFVMKGIISFEYNPELVSPETLDDFSFDRGIILEKTKPYTKIVGKKMVSQYGISVQFALPLQYHNYPFDDHSIYLSLTHNYIDPHEILFKADPGNFTLDSDVSVIGWKAISHNTHYGYSEDIVDQDDATKTIRKPILVFSIDFLRIDLRNSIVIILPLLIILFLSLCCFSINYTKSMNDASNMPMGGIASLLAYEFVIYTISPTVGYLMLSDMMFLTTLTLLFMIFLLSTRLDRISLLTKKMFIVFIHSTACISFLFFIFYGGSW